MNKKIIIAGTILLLGAVATFAYSRRPSTVPEPITSLSPAQTTNEASEFAKALESGRPTVCTITKGSDTMEYRIKGKLTRANISTTVENQTTVSHMINDGSYFYVWADGQNQGSKIILAASSPAAGTNGNQTTGPDLADEADYTALQQEGYTIDCKGGNVSDSDFVPPTGISFIDPSAVMQAIPSAGGTIDYQKLQEQYGSLNEENN